MNPKEHTVFNVVFITFHLQHDPSLMDLLTFSIYYTPPALMDSIDFLDIWYDPQEICLKIWIKDLSMGNIFFVGTQIYRKQDCFDVGTVAVILFQVTKL